MTTLNITHQDDIAIVQLDRGRSNPINNTMWSELIETFTNLENDKGVKGVVLTGKERFFSAGLDVIELYNYDKDEMKKLFSLLSQCLEKMFKFSKPFVAAITGHSPAGGCVMAICADYRVMAEGKYKIGLNEIPVGIIMPEFIYQIYALLLGKSKAYQYILEGKLVDTATAKDVGMIDEIVAENEVLEVALKQIKKYTAMSQNTWQKSKRNMRQDVYPYFEKVNENSFDDVLEQWWSDETRTILGNLIAQLTKK
ncbi:MAG: enoyl-CoA hydratase/isomerase family protein [Chitinophagales bacterium]